MKRNKNKLEKIETEKEKQIESSFYRLIFVGDNEVGKTQIINIYNNKIFQEDYSPTFCVDFQIKTIKINGRNINIHCIDTQGMEASIDSTNSNFTNDTGSLFIQKADAFIYVFDITSRQSLYNLNDYFKIIKICLTDSQKMINEKIVYLVGNKCDLNTYREVQENEGMMEANKHNAKYLEVSAKSGRNINRLFNYIIQDILKKEEQSYSIDSGGGGSIYKSIYRNNDNININNDTNESNINIIDTNTNMNNNNHTNRNINEINTNVTDTNSNKNINNNTNINFNEINQNNTETNTNMNFNINSNINHNITSNINNNIIIKNNNNINKGSNIIEKEISGLNYDNSSCLLKSNNGENNDNDLVKNINKLEINNNNEEGHPNANNTENNYLKRCTIF